MAAEENKMTLLFHSLLCCKSTKPSVSFHLCLRRPLKSWNSTTTRSSSAPLPTTAGCSWGRGWTRASPTPTTQRWVRLCPSLCSSYLLISHCLLYLRLNLCEQQPVSLRLMARFIYISHQLLSWFDFCIVRDFVCVEGQTFCCVLAVKNTRRQSGLVFRAQNALFSDLGRDVLFISSLWTEKPDICSEIQELQHYYISIRGPSVVF